MAERAQITKNGAILLGDNVACDAFDIRPIRVVTHAHADHLYGLRKSVKCCEKVLMTKATRDLCKILNRGLNLSEVSVYPLEYNTPLKYGDETITLLKADHILGATQVLVEDAQGIRIAWSGDFRLEGTQAVDCDVLVVEATYGRPSCRRNFTVDVRALLVEMVEKQLRSGTVYVFGYHGKLQEVMKILRDADVQVPFVMPELVYDVTQVCQTHGMMLDPISHCADKDGQNLIADNLPCVAFYHMNQRKHVGLHNPRICVSGWEFQKPCRQISDREHLIALSDHSDFDGLIEYVRRTNAKQVITDNFRSDGDALAKEIRHRLGIPAVSMPQSPGQTTL
ncbi:MBL fold metallo-hydrolase [Candidatus Bathycorpusculum sp.]|uniref:MBL fold metallo-hydrolase n=1 Tax=Candidatus Bathycorpusculum sp. TaxID=2994959 RepID=UPI00281A09D4|nr:MBL fold metallo-hydrolase [Candidatus Termitimicrobium sp.]MCL2686735.1 MBL fold metallo-hydrolase [Candidatus Termitimicrobium sp.]